MKKCLYSFLLLLLLMPFQAHAMDKAWLKAAIAEHKRTFPKGDIHQIGYVKRVLTFMVDFDQEIRKRLMEDTEKPDVATVKLIQSADKFNASKLEEILSVYGWITISKFGSEFDHKAWLLVQHADQDPFFQAGVLQLLMTLAPKGETEVKNMAYLYDRVAEKFHNIGMLQKYGTQVTIDNCKIELQPYEGSLDDVELRRQSIGLGSLEEYLRILREQYHC